MSLTEGDDLDRLVGSNVQTYRKSRGLSQADLAAAISTPQEGVHQQTILKIEKGTRPLKLSEAVRIAEALEITPFDLVRPSKRAAANAWITDMHVRLDQSLVELLRLAEETAPLMAALAHRLARQTAKEADEQADPAVRKGALNVLKDSWGKIFDQALLSELRRLPSLTTVSSEFDAETYIGVLRKITDFDWPTDDDPTT